MNINVLSILFLVFTTLLAAADIWSTSADDVIVKKKSTGHRAATPVDTFDDHGSHDNTKVSISHPTEAKHSASQSAEQAKHTKGKIAAGMDWITGVTNLLSTATAYGTTVWMTFVSTHVLDSTLPRQQFGMVQSRLYPVYFKTVALSTGLALLSHLVGKCYNIGLLQAWNLVGVMGVVGVNGLWLEPVARKAMLERMKVEKEEGRGGGAWQMGGLTEGEKERRVRVVKLNGRVKKVNRYSAWLNVVSFLGLTWHLVHLGHRLQFN
ncbi:Transmembrane protein 205 [Linum grandiflorum]